MREFIAIGRETERFPWGCDVAEPLPEYMHVKMNGTNQVRKFLVGEGRVIIKNGLGVEYRNGCPVLPETECPTALVPYVRNLHESAVVKVLIAIKSCHRDRHLNVGHRQTWVQDVYGADVDAHDPA